MSWIRLPSHVSCHGVAIVIIAIIVIIDNDGCKCSINEKNNGRRIYVTFDRSHAKSVFQRGTETERNRYHTYAFMVIDL